MITITKQHKEQFSQMRKRLAILGCRETNFTSVEILFYEALAIARSYGNDSGNTLLRLFQELEVTEYRSAMARYAKSAQREKAIKRFMTRFKGLLALVIKEAAELAEVE